MKKIKYNETWDARISYQNGEKPENEILYLSTAFEISNTICTADFRF